jgi:type IV secretory pathway VirJ component
MAAAAFRTQAAKMRTYLSTPHAEQVAADLEPVVRGQMKEWDQSDIVIIGYSRSADTAPFIVNRWPSDCAARTRPLGLIGETTRLEFHWEDLAIDVSALDIPTRPELEKLMGQSILCFRGEGQRNQRAPDRSVPCG